MKLKDVLAKVTKETFEIYDYGEIEDPVSYHIKNIAPTGEIPIFNTNNYFTEDDKKFIFWRTVHDVIDQTFRAIASEDVVSCVYFSSKAVSTESVRWLVTGVVSTVVENDFTSFDNSDSIIVVPGINNSIIVVKVENTDDFNFERALTLIRMQLKKYPPFKLILVGGNDLIQTRIAPVLNRYAELMKENETLKGEKKNA